MPVLEYEVQWSTENGLDHVRVSGKGPLLKVERESSFNNAGYALLAGEVNAIMEYLELKFRVGFAPGCYFIGYWSVGQRFHAVINVLPQPEDSSAQIALSQLFQIRLDFAVKAVDWD